MILKNYLLLFDKINLNYNPLNIVFLQKNEIVN